jgi:hypothetical protein
MSETNDLRVVLAELHAVTTRDTVSLHGAWARFDADGKIKDPACGSTAKVMIDQLAWWAHALRDAKTVRPYAA